MNRTRKTLLGFLAASALLAGALFTTGCETLDRAKEEYPIAYDALKGTAQIVLLSQVPQITDDPAEQMALRGVIRAGFAAGARPKDVAIALADGVQQVYPDDATLQNMIAAEWAAALRTPPDTTTPASTPGARQYQLDLADALAPSDAPAGAVFDYQRDKPNVPTDLQANVDWSLWGLITKEETRKARRAYYAAQDADPEDLERARKLNALREATADDGTVNHRVYRYHANQ